MIWLTIHVTGPWLWLTDEIWNGFFWGGRPQKSNNSLTLSCLCDRGRKPLATKQMSRLLFSCEHALRVNPTSAYSVLSLQSNLKYEHFTIYFSRGDSSPRMNFQYSFSKTSLWWAWFFSVVTKIQSWSCRCLCYSLCWQDPRATAKQSRGRRSCLSVLLSLLNWASPGKSKSL